MFGEPNDVAGECNARLYLADNFGDNHATIRCQREPGHAGRHREEFDRENPEGYIMKSHIRIEWDIDERKVM